MLVRDKKTRFYYVALFFLALPVLVTGRLLYIQILRAPYFIKLASNQQEVSITLPAQKGDILDRQLRKLATSLNCVSIYASPRAIPRQSLPYYIRALTRELKLPEAEVSEKLHRDKSFVWLKRQVFPEEVARLRKVAFKNIGFLEEPKRVYPNKTLACHLIGFSGIDNKGLEGIEASYEHYLKGVAGWRLRQRDAMQRDLAAFEYGMVAPRDGDSVVLTIDATLQYIAESSLEWGCKKFNAKGGSCVVMNPATGEILALANYPVYDPNAFSAYSRDTYRNKAITDVFEPGSVFKIVTASAALEEGVIAPHDKVYCEKGEFTFASHTLHDHEPYATLTFREVISQSSNIGTAKVAMRLGQALLYKYIKRYGFGAKTGIDLPGEVVGISRPPSQWSKLSIGVIPIGQEIGVTELQLATAFSAIANDGVMMRPFVVWRVLDRQGNTLHENKPKMVRRVISPDTNATLKDILKDVVNEGTGTKAKIGDFQVAGKTGTAQKLDDRGRYSHNKFTASFVGFLPVDHPALTIAVVVDEPRPVYYGGSVAAPIFKKIAESSVRYVLYNSEDTQR